MSGICGVIGLDGSEPSPRLLAAMTARLATRGPDGQIIWCEGSVGLGHALLATTPESLHETLPFVDRATGCVIVADARLDNREDLFEALAIPDAGRTIGDGELILRAWQKWGASAPTHLLGDFAFAIWDGRKRKLFGARDHMGMRQLLYCHVPGKCFIFATEPGSILLHPQVPNQINYGRIADFIEDYLEGIDFTSTFFEGIFRLPPATTFSLENGRFNTSRYWKPTIDREVRYSSDREYAEHLRAVLARAVDARLRSAKPIGSMLSGGLDSNSVVALAATSLQDAGRAPLKTYSAVGPRIAPCRETDTIYLAAKRPDIEPTFVNHAELGGDLPALRALAQEAGEPFDFDMSIIHAVYLAASKDGVNVVLDGVGSDVVLNHGDWIDVLFRTGKLRRGYSEMAGLMKFFGGSSPNRAVLRQIAKTLATPFGLSLAKQHTRRNLPGHFSERDVFSDEFAERVDLKSRRQAFFDLYPSPYLSNRENRAARILHTFPVVGRERYDRVAAQFGIEARDPFMDVRVVECCLSFPADQMLRNGWPKYVLRNAMEGLLRPEVSWRSGKEHVGGDFISAILAHLVEKQAVQYAIDELQSLDLLTKDMLDVDRMTFETSRRIIALSTYLKGASRNPKFRNNSHSPSSVLEMSVAGRGEVDA